MDKYKFIGHLHALWWWGLDNADEEGCIGDTTPIELADACGVPTVKADLLLAALKQSRFLDETPSGLCFHDWHAYTWRFHENKAKQKDASNSGAFGNHKRWHLDRAIVAPDCEFCIGSGVAPMSGGDSGASRYLSPLPSDRPSLLPSVPANLPNLRHALNFLPDEIRAIEARAPGTDFNKRWGEWIHWIEEGGVRENKYVRMPDDKIRAFIGFLKADITTGAVS